MPYLTCIGAHGATESNSNGVGSRGYWVFRRGRVVVARFGPVRVVRARIWHIEWAAAWTEKRYRLGSERSARAFLTGLLKEKTDPSHGYTRMRTGVSIRRQRRKP